MGIFEDYYGVLFEITHSYVYPHIRWKYKIIHNKSESLEADNDELWYFEDEEKKKIYASYNGKDYLSVSEDELSSGVLYSAEGDISDDFLILNEYAGGILVFQKRDDHKYKFNILAVLFDDGWENANKPLDELFLKWKHNWGDTKELDKKNFTLLSLENNPVHFLRYCYQENLFKDSYLNSIIKSENVLNNYFEDLTPEQLEFSSNIVSLTSWGLLFCFLNIYKFSHRLFQNDIVTIYFSEKGKDKTKINIHEIAYNISNRDISSFQISIPKSNTSSNILKGNPLPYCDIRHDVKELASCFVETAFNDHFINHFNNKWEITAYVASDFEYFFNYELENMFSYLKYCLSLKMSAYKNIKGIYEYKRLNPNAKPEYESYSQQDFQRLAQSGLNDMNQVDSNWRWNID